MSICHSGQDAEAPKISPTIVHAIKHRECRQIEGAKLKDEVFY
jgi:hypothetical protein